MDIEAFSKLLEVVSTSGLPIVISVLALGVGLYFIVRWLPNLFDQILSRMDTIVKVTTEAHEDSKNDRRNHNEAIEKKIDEGNSVNRELVKEVVTESKEVYKVTLAGKSEQIKELRNENKNLYERMIDMAHQLPAETYKKMKKEVNKDELGA